MKRARRVATVAIVGVTALVAVGCSSNGATASSRPSPAGARQPSAAAGRFADVSLDQVPRYPRGKALGPVTEADGVVTQSLSAPNTTPSAIVQWYATNLHGWDAATDPHRVGPTDWRGVWTSDRGRLTVSASPAPTVSTSPAAVGAGETEYTLQLRR